MKGVVVAAAGGMQPRARAAVCAATAALLRAGLREMLCIAAPREMPALQTLLGDGEHCNALFAFALQSGGGAHAFASAEEFLGGHAAACIVADGTFSAHGIAHALQQAASHQKGARAFALRARTALHCARARFDSAGKVRALEECAGEETGHALAGAYVYDATAAARARELPRAAGFTELNRAYLAEDALQVSMLGAEDANTSTNLNLSETMHCQNFLLHSARAT